MKTLVLVEHDGGAVKDATLAAVTAASQAGRSPPAGRRQRASAASPRPRRRSPASGKVHVADGAHLEHQLAEDVAPLAAALMADHDAFLAPATTTGKNIAPRVAALLDVMQISRHPVGRGRRHLHPPDLRRQRHRHGRSRATPRRSSPCAAPPSRRPRAEGGSRHGRGGRRGAATRASRASSAPSSSKSERPELTSAKVIVSGGRALRLAASSSTRCIDPLADKLGAARRRQPRARSTRAMRPTTTRSARPARSSPRRSISRSASRARSSTSRA